MDAISQQLRYTAHNNPRTDNNKDPWCLCGLDCRCWLRKRKHSSHSNNTKVCVQTLVRARERNSCVKHKTQTSHGKKTSSLLLLECVFFRPTPEECSLQGLVYWLGTLGCDIHLRGAFESFVIESKHLSCIGSGGFANSLAGKQRDRKWTECRGVFMVSSGGRVQH